MITQKEFMMLRSAILNGTAKEKGMAEMRLCRELKVAGGEILKIQNVFLPCGMREEAVMSAVFEVFRNLAKYNAVYTYKAWYGRIVLNKAYDMLRGGRVRGADKTDSIEVFYKTDSDGNRSLDVPDRFVCPSENMDRQWVRMQLHGFIKRLKKPEQVLVIMWLEGKTLDEMANETGWNKNNIKVTLCRAKKKLEAFGKDQRNK